MSERWRGRLYVGGGVPQAWNSWTGGVVRNREETFLVALVLLRWIRSPEEALPIRARMPSSFLKTPQALSLSELIHLLSRSDSHFTRAIRIAPPNSTPLIQTGNEGRSQQCA